MAIKKKAPAASTAAKGVRGIPAAARRKLAAGKPSASKTKPKPRPSAKPKPRPSAKPKPRPSAKPKPRPPAKPKPRPPAKPKPRPPAKPKPRPPAKPKPRPSAKPRSGRKSDYVPNISEQYMNPKQRAWFGSRLESMLDQAAGRMGEILGIMPEQVMLFPDENDRASQEAEFALELRERDRDSHLASKIENALNRIKDGSYGYCSDCGLEIGLKRMRARPVAAMCIDCKRLQENREKH